LGGDPALHLTTTTRKPIMLMTLAIILIVLWALGLIGGYTAGGLVHVLLVIALVVVILRVLSGRRVL
jgi:hypothetical protein